MAAFPLGQQSRAAATDHVAGKAENADSQALHIKRLLSPDLER